MPPASSSPMGSPEARAYIQGQQGKRGQAAGEGAAMQPGSRTGDQNHLHMPHAPAWLLVRACNRGADHLPMPHAPACMQFEFKRAAKHPCCPPPHAKGACMCTATAPAPVAAAAAPSSSPTAFEELSAGTSRKYIMVSGKGGVGKTSLSAALSVRLAQVRG